MEKHHGMPVPTALPKPRCHCLTSLSELPRNQLQTLLFPAVSSGPRTLSHASNTMAVKDGSGPRPAAHTAKRRFLNCLETSSFKPCLFLPSARSKNPVAGLKPCLSNFLFSPLVASKASSDALPLVAAGVGGFCIKSHDQFIHEFLGFLQIDSPCFGETCIPMTVPKDQTKRARDELLRASASRSACRWRWAALVLALVPWGMGDQSSPWVQYCTLW